MDINKIDSKTSIIIISVVLVMVVGAIVMFLRGNEVKRESLSVEGEVKFSPEAYATERGLTRYFHYQDQWYENIGGEWNIVKSAPAEAVKSFAERNGFKKYFRYLGEWYANVDGEWQLVGVNPPPEALKEYAERNGFKKYFRYLGEWYANVNGEWHLVANQEEARRLGGT